MNPKSTRNHWHPKPLGSALALFLSFACMALAVQFASAATRVVSVTGDLEFGQVAAGSTAQRTFTISNTGNQNLVVQSIQYPSGFSGDFVSGPVHPGDSQLVTVTFAPTSATAYGGTVTVTCNKTSGTNTLAISGTGTNPPPTRIISLSGDLTFPGVLVGSSAQLTLTITNSGNSPLSVTGISLPTGFSGDFSGSIAANGTQAVTITFSPTDAVEYLGTVTIQSDSTAGGNTVSASGTGLALTRTVSLGGTLDFGDVTVGASAQRTLYITNAGNSTLTVSDITYPTAFDGAFAGTIAPGAVQSVLVTFSPSVETSYAGTVTVNSDATSGINTANASGNGTPVPTKFISLSGDLEFGGVLAGSSAQLTFSITNAGTAVLNISNIIYPTGFSGDFNSGAMDPGAVQSVLVTFSPVAAVDYTGTVTVDSDAASGLNSFTISGIGTNLPVNPIIALSDALDFGDVMVGSSAQRSLLITNVGDAALTISAIAYPAGFTGDFSSGTIGVGAVQTVTVTFSPESATDYAGTVTIDSDATSGGNGVAVSGTGFDYIAAKMRFNGLFYPAADVDFTNAGFFQLSSGTKRTFSAKLRLAGKRYSFSGQFSPDGAVSGSIVRKGSTPLSISLQAGFNEGDTLKGTISDGAWTAEILADRATFNKKTNPAPQAGSYAVTILGSNDPLASPEANGSGTATIAASGIVKFKGTLGDGTKVSQATVLSKAGDWPFFSLFPGASGAMVGWLNVTNNPGQEINGFVDWFKLPQANTTNFPAGFTAQTTVTGSKL